MKIVIFEDKWFRRHKMLWTIRKGIPEAECHMYKKTGQVLHYIEDCHPEVAFVSMENEDGRGYFLIKKIRKLCPKTNVIVVASRYRFMKEMVALRVSGYVTDPLTAQRVREEMQHLRYAQGSSEPVISNTMETLGT